MTMERGRDEAAVVTARMVVRAAMIVWVLLFHLGASQGSGRALHWSADSAPTK